MLDVGGCVGEAIGMVPPEFTTFFVTCAMAAATLIGLLFVAVSIAPEATVMESAPVERQAVAASAFTALVNVFFIAAGAQIPRINIGGLVTLFGGIGLLGTAALLRPLLRTGATRPNQVRRLILVAVSLVMYLSETWQGLLLLRRPTDIGSLYTLCGLLMGVIGLSLIRAWQLLGVRRYGILSWLNPLQDLGSPKPPTPTSDQQPDAADRKPKSN
jgi:hypothetical protein